VNYLPELTLTPAFEQMLLRQRRAPLAAVQAGLIVTDMTAPRRATGIRGTVHSGVRSERLDVPDPINPDDVSFSNPW
jgi:hypothetical protein